MTRYKKPKITGNIEPLEETFMRMMEEAGVEFIDVALNT